MKDKKIETPVETNEAVEGEVMVERKRKSKFVFPTTHILRYVYIGLIFLFCILPLVFLLINITSADSAFVFKDSLFYEAMGNSFLYASISALLSTLLALITAYYLSRASISKKIKRLFVLLFTIPMLIPTLSVGLGLRTLFGINGFLDLLLGIEIESIGFFGLILGSIIISFPPTFLIIYDALKYEDKAPYDAAEIAGINKFSTFFRVTLPYLVKPLITAFFACFTLIFADYGIPMELAGKVKTLPMYLYEQINAVYKYGRGALVGVFLLIPAVMSFIVDLFLKEDVSGDASKAKMQSSKLFNILTYVISIIAVIIIITPEISFVSLSLVKKFPNDMTFTLDNVKKVFENTGGMGLPTFIKNSLVMSLLTGLFGTIFAYTIAYFSTRLKGVSSKILHFLSISSIAIPGIVLGVGYVFLFKDTNGFFYGTIAILVVVNVFHFLGSPYLMARNVFLKMNKDYEIVGQTIGVNKFKIFLNVLLPNSLSTLLEMFSYFFLNSMITISAVAFLFTYKTQPLALQINVFEKNGDYEMQAVVSLVILVINLVFKGGFGLLSSFINKKMKGRGEEEIMELSRYQFNLLTFLEKEGKGKYSQRQLADALTLSLGTINKVVKELTELNFIAYTSSGSLYITDKGIKALEPYKVRKAIIIAAGFGSRMVPVTLDTPKPLVKVNGVRIIDTLLDALYAKDIKNITIVVGYLKEQFQQLVEKYPTIKFIENPIYNESNNISSMFAAKDIIDRCYICEADLVISNPEVITKYQYSSNYLGAHVAETDDWCFYKKRGYIDRVAIGGEDCWHMIGISYWNEKDSNKLREDIVKVFNSRGGKEKYWDNVPLTVCKKDFNIEVRDCLKSDVTEIDNFSELVIIDPSYKDYKSSR